MGGMESKPVEVLQGAREQGGFVQGDVKIHDCQERAKMRAMC